MQLKIGVPDQNYSIVVSFEEMRDFSLSTVILHKYGFNIGSHKALTSLGYRAQSPTLSIDTALDFGPRLSSITPIPGIDVSLGSASSQPLPSRSSIDPDLLARSRSIPSVSIAGDAIYSPRPLSPYANGDMGTLPASQPFQPMSHARSLLNPYDIFVNRNTRSSVPRAYSPLRTFMSQDHHDLQASYLDHNYVDSPSHQRYNPPPRQEELQRMGNDHSHRNVFLTQQMVTPPSSSGYPGAFSSQSPSQEHCEPSYADIEKAEGNFRVGMPQPRSLPFTPTLENSMGSQSKGLRQPSYSSQTVLSPVNKSYVSSSQIKSKGSKELDLPKAPNIPIPLSSNDNDSAKTRVVDGCVKRRTPRRTKVAKAIAAQSLMVNDMASCQELHEPDIIGANASQEQDDSMIWTAPSAAKKSPQVSHAKPRKRSTKTPRAGRKLSNLSISKKKQPKRTSTEPYHSKTTTSSEPSAVVPSNGDVEPSSPQSPTHPVRSSARLRHRRSACQETIPTETAGKTSPRHEQDSATPHKHQSSSSRCNVEVDKPSTPELLESDPEIEASIPVPQCEQFLLLAGAAVLDSINAESSKLLEQYEADVAKGCDAGTYAQYYLDRIDAVRTNFWHSRLLDVEQQTPSECFSI